MAEGKDGLDVLDFLVSAIAIVLVIAFGIVVLPIAAVVLLVRWLYKRARGEKATPPRGSASKATALLDDDATQAEVVATASNLTDDEVLGTYAQNVLATLETAERRRVQIFSVLDNEFEEGSLTWEKYHAPVEVALDRVRQNTIQIVNRLQSVDSKEYQRMGRIERAGGYAADAPEVGRLETMRATLDDTTAFAKANDQLLAELEKLQAELTKLTGSATDTDEIIAEIKRLADDTKYYS